MKLPLISSEFQKRGFTLVELMVSATVTVLIASIMFGIVSQTSRLLGRTTAKMDQFRQARNAFEVVTTQLAQATLNTYFDYDQRTNPTKFERRSELRFISGPASQVFFGGSPSGKLRSTHAVFFQAPFGETNLPDRYAAMENTLCAWGYYLEVGSDASVRPSFMTDAIIPPRIRPRLIEFSQPAENNNIYRFTSGLPNRFYSNKDWYVPFVASATAPVHVVAENIVAMIITPRLSASDERQVKGTAGAADPDYSPLAPNYLYDSSPLRSIPAADAGRYGDGRTNPMNQLPPVLQVTFVATDEPGAVKIGYSKTSLDPLQLETYFKDTRKYSKDLYKSAGGDSSLEAKLIATGANYRVFSTNVILRGAKWSREQVNR